MGAQSSVSFSASQLKAITEAVADLAEKSSVENEKRQLHELKGLLEKRKAEMVKDEKVNEETDKIQQDIDKQLKEDEEAKQTSPELVEEIPKEETEEITTEESQERKRKQEKEIQKQKENVIKIGDKLESFVDKLQNSAEEMESKDIPFILGLDKDRDGYVDLEELQEATKEFQAHLPSDLVQHVLKKLDGDNDNKISLRELAELANKHK